MEGDDFGGNGTGSADDRVSPPFDDAVDDRDADSDRVGTGDDDVGGEAAFPGLVLDEDDGEGTADGEDDGAQELDLPLLVLDDDVEEAFGDDELFDVLSSPGWVDVATLPQPDALGDTAEPDLAGRAALDRFAEELWHRVAGGGGDARSTGPEAKLHDVIDGDGVDDDVRRAAEVALALLRSATDEGDGPGRVGGGR